MNLANIIVDKTIKDTHINHYFMMCDVSMDKEYNYLVVFL